MKKELMLGNAAIARGAYEAGVMVSSAYPGTPSTEISEELAKYEDVYCEWAPNEKVALEVAIGASMQGVRAMASMKHVGLNVAADPLFTASYIGVNGGLVIVVSDDPGMHSSQNEQDTRMMAKAAKIPVLEPSDSQEAKDFMKEAFEMSEVYDTPVIVRTTTRLSHSQSLVKLEDRVDVPRKIYEKDIPKNVMTPGNAVKRHPIVNRNLDLLENDASIMEHINEMVLGDREFGFITSGIPYQYLKEVFPEASFLKLGLVHPLPVERIKSFAKAVDRLIIVEELEPVIENEIKALGISCEGKELFSREGEYSANLLREVLLGENLDTEPEETPIRPPILCPGCPHRSTFYMMKKAGIRGAGDIGCYTLGAGKPLERIESTICMGASISSLHGMEKAIGKEELGDWVAVIGDSTFLHTGVNSLMNMTYNQSKGTVLILDNSTTGMTGHQENPATGYTLQGEETKIVDLKKLCQAVGVDHVRVISSFNLEELEEALKEEVKRDEVSVIISQSPCALLPGVAIKNQYYVEEEECKKCGICLDPGCPALSRDEENRAVINNTLCNGCGLCYNLCPFDAIHSIESIIEEI